MKKWSGGFLIGSLVVVLVIRYCFVAKSPGKQSAYDFFNNHPPQIQQQQQHTDSGSGSVSDDDDNTHNNNNNNNNNNAYKSFWKRPELVSVEGLDELFHFGNVSEQETRSLLVWREMKSLLCRSDALPETSHGIKEAALAWTQLLNTITIDKKNKEKNVDVKESNITCPYHVSMSNETSNNLEIPCGLVVDSSITVIGIPDMQMLQQQHQQQNGSFRIELVGSKLPQESEPEPPIVLHYSVVPVGENLTKDPVIIQNTWIDDVGWGSEERCPPAAPHASTHSLEVDGLAKCNAKVVRSSLQEKLDASQPRNEKLTNVSDGSGSTSSMFPFVEGTPFTATLWAGNEGFHMTVNGRHETSFAYRKLEPWLVSGVNVSGGLHIVSILATALPVSEDLGIGIDVEQLKAPEIPKKRLTMLIGVFSTGNNFERRMAIRRSWMQYEAVRSGNVAVRFLIGLNKNMQVNFELWREAEAYGDIQLMPFVDYYSLLTLKTVAICILGTKVMPAKYIMKTDDDAFVRIDEVVSSLKTKASSGLLYGLVSFESEPHRDKGDKWYVSIEEWPNSTFPPWAHGPGYIISRDIAKFIVQGHDDRGLPLFKLEDVAVGIWIDEYKRNGHQVEYINDDRFYNAGCESNYILAHYQSPRMVLCLWEKLQNEHEPNCCE